MPRGSEFLRGASDVGGALLPSVIKILEWCAGLPIALSVVGSTVSLLRRRVDTFETACEMYATDFEERETRLGSLLSGGILLSLKHQQDEFANWKKRNEVDIKHNISDLYIGLCVLRKQLWVPVSVLSGMWILSRELALDIANLFCGMSLASISYQKTGNISVFWVFW